VEKEIEPSILIEIRDLLRDIGKVLDNQTQILKFIAQNSQEQNDWESWKRF